MTTTMAADDDMMVVFMMMMVLMMMSTAYTMTVGDSLPDCYIDWLIESVCL